MSEAGDRLVSLMPGAAALPRSNGELVFRAPWESRAFGMAVGLYDCERWDWDDFRRLLVEEIARRPAEPDAPPFDYYACWLAALERLVVDRGLLAAAEIEARTQEYATGLRDEF